MKKVSGRWLGFVLIFLVGPFTSILSGARVRTPDEFIPSRLSQFVEANILAVHAYQVGLAKLSGKGNLACYSAGGLDEAALRKIVEHQSSLLETDPDILKAWLLGIQLPNDSFHNARASVTARFSSLPFDPAQDLNPILNCGLVPPDHAVVNEFTRFLKSEVHAPDFQVRAIANLYQTVMEVERDGDLLQRLMDSYIDLGLPVYVGQFGLPGSDEDFLQAGRELAARSCPSPFATDAAAWQIAGRKIWNWGEKKLHIRDENVLARELLAEPEMQPLIPLMRNMPQQKIAIIGHSFTMGIHWSSPASFVQIVAAILAAQNPGIQFRQFQAGGLTAARALHEFLSVSEPDSPPHNRVRLRAPFPRAYFDEAVVWKPDQVLLVVAVRGDEDLAAIKQMGEGFAREGIRSFIFDDIGDPASRNSAMLDRFHQAALSAGFSIIEVKALLATAPDRSQFLCLDGIHMKEPYHRLMAKEWLKFLIGARGLQLGEAPRGTEN